MAEQIKPPRMAGVPRPEEFASKLFGYSDPDENAKWLKQHNEYMERREQRRSSDHVDSIQLASMYAPNAARFAKERGEALDSRQYGVETGIIPGHMSRDQETIRRSPLGRSSIHDPQPGYDMDFSRPSAPQNEPEVQEKEPSRVQAAVDRMMAQFGRRDEPSGPSLPM